MTFRSDLSLDPGHLLRVNDELRRQVEDLEAGVEAGRRAAQACREVTVALRDVEEVLDSRKVEDGPSIARRVEALCDLAAEHDEAKDTMQCERNTAQTLLRASERTRDETMVVLSMLLDLHDPPSEARRRRHAADENGWGMALGGAVRIGRQIIPRPDPCRMCRGGGADEYGAECSDCDGEGYKRAPEPVTKAENAVWDAIGREVSKRAREE